MAHVNFDLTRTWGADQRLVFESGAHCWIFNWAPGSESELIDAVSEIARDRDQPFDWIDAAIVAHQVAQRAENCGNRTETDKKP